MKGWTQMMMSEICMMRIFPLNDVNFELPVLVLQSDVANHTFCLFLTVAYKKTLHFKQLSLCSD